VIARTWLTCCCLVWLVVSAPALAHAGKRSPLSRLKGVDLSGRSWNLGERSDTQAVVVCFLSTQCPISNGYLPLLGRLAEQYGAQGVEVFGVISDPAVTRAEARRHREQYDIEFPVLFDASGQLRRALAPTHTPHAMVLNREGRLIYEGLLDDRYADLGSKKVSPGHPYLENAITSVLHDLPLKVAKTEPIGCLLEDPPDKSASGNVTYTRDIAPIVQAHCVRCHRTGQSAPFPLRDYEEVSRHANQILAVTESRFMPPWKPEPGFTRLRDPMRLTDEELGLLQAWVDAGKPRGDRDELPTPAEYTEGWQLGQPDLVLEMNEVFEVPASGPDLRQYFVIPSGLTEDRLVSAIEFRPGTPRAIHHASFYLDNSGAARRLDRADPDPGYAGFGGPKFPTQGTLNSWFPGMTPRHLPDGMGRLIRRGSDLVAEIHYVPTGKPERDRSTLGLHFAPRSARKVAVEVQVGNKQIRIPPGEARHHERAVYRLPVATTLLDLTPHMHLLGREMRVWSKAPDGSTRPLLWIKDWDFNWQGQYAFAKPVSLPKGTQLIVDAWFDNSSGNPLNPNSPPKTVRWGNDSTDEMLLCHFQCTCDRVEQLKELMADQRDYIAEAGRR
jgi:peroxiredoxin